MPTVRWLFLAMICSMLVCANSCKKPSPPSEKDSPLSSIEKPFQGEASAAVLFDMKSSSDGAAPDDGPIYDCSYQARGKTAKFRLQFKKVSTLSNSMVFGEGRFLSVAGSDNATLLEDLKTALEAKQLPKKFSRITQLPFDIVVLGEKQSRESSGGYSRQPPGDWIATKIFLPKGGDDGEVFLNLNPVLGKGEFTIKDVDYGDYVLQELAKVL